MRAKLLGLLLFAALPGWAFAQSTYFVTKVKGAVLRSNGQPLLAGEQVKQSEPLTLKDTSSAVFVLDDRDIPYKIIAYGGQADITDAANFLATPVRKGQKQGSSSTIPDSKIADIASFFSNVRLLLLFNETLLCIDTERLALSDDLMLVFSFKINGQPVSKRIAYSNGCLTISKERLLETRLGTIKTELVEGVNAFLYNAKTKEYKLLATFSLAFEYPEMLSKELRIVAKHFKDQGLAPDAIKRSMVSYISDFYGTPKAADAARVIDMAINAQ